MLTAKLTAKKGGLAGAMIVREHQDLLFISVNGMVQRTSVKGISRMGRATQGVKVMNIADDDRVSAVAIVVEQQEAEALPEGERSSPSELPLEARPTSRTETRRRTTDRPRRADAQRRPPRSRRHSCSRRTAPSTDRTRALRRPDLAGLLQSADQRKEVVLN